MRAKDSAIPAALRALPIWCRWSRETTARGQKTKRPDGSTLDPAMPRSFLEVEDVEVSADGGVGCVLTGRIQRTDGAVLLAFDLDACRDPVTGAPAEWARQEIDYFQRSYTEITPSGTGYRIWVWVRDPPKAVPIIHMDAEPPPGVSKRPEIQVFGCGAAGYVTATGVPSPGVDAELATLPHLRSWLARHRVEEAPSSEDALPTGSQAVNGDILPRVLQHPHAEALVAGRWAEVYPDKSASEAYWSLVRIVLQECYSDGAVAADFLLHRTAFGRGEVDSRDPDKYRRASWVHREIIRVHDKTKSPFKAIPAAKPRRQRLYPLDEFARIVAEQRYLVHGMFPRRGLAQLFGDPSSGKTAVALHLALHVALGLPRWFGHDVDVEGRVIYLVGEDPTGVRDRALTQLRALDPLASEASVAGRFWASVEPGRLSVREDVDAWIRDIQHTADGQCSLLIADTQARNFGPGNENSTEDMTQFITQLDRLWRALDCLVLLVHHTGHGDKSRGRGASVLPAALDASYRVTRKQEAVRLHAVRVKSCREPEDLHGSMHEQVIELDERGRPRTAVIFDDKPAPVGASFFDDALLGQLIEMLRSLAGQPVTRETMENVLGISRRRLADLVAHAQQIGVIQQIHETAKSGNVYVLSD